MVFSAMQRRRNASSRRSRAAMVLPAGAARKRSVAVAPASGAVVSLRSRTRPVVVEPVAARPAVAIPPRVRSLRRTRPSRSIARFGRACGFEGNFRDNLWRKAIRGGVPRACVGRGLANGGRKQAGGGWAGRGALWGGRAGRGVAVGAGMPWDATRATGGGGRGPCGLGARA